MKRIKGVMTAVVAAAFCGLAAATGEPVPSAARIDSVTAAQKAALLQRVAQEDAEGRLRSRGFVYYIVPPVSNVMRTALAYPQDGTREGALQVVAAQGEFEPASLVLFAEQDAENVTVKTSDLADSHGHAIPARHVDAKIVKIWVQTGCAWYSYFSDSAGRTLVPELLLNDENLVKVDTAEMNNYLRTMKADGSSEYLLISSPIDYNIPVQGLSERIFDAKELRPFTLKRGEFKQLWFTVEVPETAEAGMYHGTVSVIAPSGTATVPLQVNVLPFRLPKPMTNYDISREYHVSSYNGNKLSSYLQGGMSQEDAEKRLLNQYISYRKHNLTAPMVAPYASVSESEKALCLRQLEIYRDAGLDTDTLFDAVRGIPDYTYLDHPDRSKPLAEQNLPDQWEELTSGYVADIQKLLGKMPVIYCFGWDEPGMRLLRNQRAAWKYLHDNGLRVLSTGHQEHLLHAGFNEDFVDYGGTYSAESARLWHAFGARISSYASPHTGPENPDFVRRTHGMDLYLADNDGTINYMAAGDQWNDFGGADYNYRSFNHVYPTTDGHVDTIEFEGFREAIDDVKYATLLRQLAQKAIETQKTANVYKGKAALQWLIQVDSRSCDLNALRLEMIRYILELRGLK